MCGEQAVAVQFHQNSSVRNAVAATDLINGITVSDRSFEVSACQCRGVVDEDADLGEPDSGSVHRYLAAPGDFFDRSFGLPPLLKLVRRRRRHWIFGVVAVRGLFTLSSECCLDTDRRDAEFFGDLGHRCLVNSLTEPNGVMESGSLASLGLVASANSDAESSECGKNLLVVDVQLAGDPFGR
jgi:hypothetical protein